MKKGFTLIEVILVIAIICILSGITFVASLGSLKSSKVEGFSIEALSLINKLYDYQSSRSDFVESDLETYNIVFEKNNNNVAVTLKNKDNEIDSIKVSNIVFISDINIRFKEEGYKTLGEDVNIYAISFNSKGEILRSLDNSFEILSNLEIEVFIGENYSKTIKISTPPMGNIFLEDEKS